MEKTYHANSRTQVIRQIGSPMTRPCFLVIDREYSGTISTRKLVIESAKFNVITAYSGQEALETFERFPNVDGAVLNASLQDIACETVIARIRERSPNAPIIVIQGPREIECSGASHYLDSFDPAHLLELLHKLFPQASQAIKQQDDVLKSQETGR
jgi:DNA-binding response OmpR family regulator